MTIVSIDNKDMSIDSGYTYLSVMTYANRDMVGMPLCLNALVLVHLLSSCNAPATLIAVHQQGRTGCMIAMLPPVLVGMPHFVEINNYLSVSITISFIIALTSHGFLHCTSTCSNSSQCLYCLQFKRSFYNSKIDHWARGILKCHFYINYAFNM